MDNFNYLVAELLAEQALDERRLAAVHEPIEPATERRSPKQALASTLVRLGLRLDPAAGEGLAHTRLPLMRSRS